VAIGVGTRFWGCTGLRVVVWAAGRSTRCMPVPASVTSRLIALGMGVRLATGPRRYRWGRRRAGRGGPRAGELGWQRRAAPRSRQGGGAGTSRRCL